jgi:ATP-dependent Clp protease protease subunit
MIHQPLGGAQGQASDIEIQAQEILRMKDMLNDILAHHTGQPLKRVKRDTDRDFFMSSKEAKEYGLIDEVVQRKVVEACFLRPLNSVVLSAERVRIRFAS